MPLSQHKIHFQRFQFQSLKDIESMKTNEIIDICVIVINSGTMMELISKAGKQLKVQLHAYNLN